MCSTISIQDIPIGYICIVFSVKLCCWTVYFVLSDSKNWYIIFLYCTCTTQMTAEQYIKIFIHDLHEGCEV